MIGELLISGLKSILGVVMLIAMLLWMNDMGCFRID